jgi:DnaJ-class molecular chaperone
LIITKINHGRIDLELGKTAKAALFGTGYGCVTLKNKRRNMNICSTCNGNHYVRINENTTTFCTDCNGKDEVKESVLKKAVDTFFSDKD